jgi:hypothetical protein
MADKELIKLFEKIKEQIFLRKNAVKNCKGKNDGRC